jgi:hypothetical protein
VAVDLAVAGSSYNGALEVTTRGDLQARPKFKPEGDKTMKFMTMVKSAEKGAQPPQELMAAIGKLGEEAAKAGVMVEMGGLLPSAMGARVRLSGGKVTVIDGPFAEAKEVIGGFAVFNVKSKEEAIEWTRRFMDLHKEHWKGWEGETEIRQLMEYGCPAA